MKGGEYGEPIGNNFRIEFHKHGNGSAQGTKVFLADGRTLDQVTKVKVFAEVNQPLFVQITLADQIEVAGGVLSIGYVEDKEQPLNPVLGVFENSKPGYAGTCIGGFVDPENVRGP